MTATVTNPLRSDPSFATARDLIAADRLGQRLAVYAAARARDTIDDPLTVLGLPLIDELLVAAGEVPETVTAIRLETPVGVEHWSLVLAFPSGLRASVDVGSGLGTAQPGELDLRCEWSGTEQVVLVDPTAVAVTVTSARGVRRRSAEVAPIAEALLAFAPEARTIAKSPPRDWHDAVAVIAAARGSAEFGSSVEVDRS